MGYQGKGLDINGQGIINPFQVEELPQHTGLGYDRKEVGECAKTTSEPSMTDDESPSLVLSKSTMEVKYVNFSSVSSSPSIIYVGNVEIPIMWTNKRLLTKMRYKEEEGLGVNGQGITQPLEVEKRPRFARLGCTKGKCSKMSEASMTLLKLSRKEDDGNTSPSTYGSMNCRERAKENSRSHDHT